MAEQKLYRAVYVIGEEDNMVKFTQWCIVADYANILSELAQDFGGETSPSYEIIGWEEKVLDTDPF